MKWLKWDWAGMLMEWLAGIDENWTAHADDDDRTDAEWEKRTVIKQLNEEHFYIF